MVKIYTRSNKHGQCYDGCPFWGKDATAEASLDDLYIKVLESSMSGDKNLMLIKSVLGIVSITAKNKEQTSLRCWTARLPVGNW